VRAGRVWPLENSAVGGYALTGLASATSGVGYGLLGTTYASGAGVYGRATATAASSSGAQRGATALSMRARAFGLAAYPCR
jgi:hypothetical protein